MFFESERFGKYMGEWVLILGALLMPLVIFTQGYRIAATPKFFVFVGVVLGIGIAVLFVWQSINWKRVPFVLPWVAFLAYTSVRVFSSLNVDAAVEILLLQIFGGVVGIGAALLVDHCVRMYRAIAIVGSVVALLGILEYMGVFLPLPSGGRPSATLGFRNIAGMYLAIGVFLGAGLFLQSNQKDRWLGIVSVTAMMVFLIFTRTRGAWVGVLVAGLCGLFVVWRVVGRDTLVKWLLTNRVGLVVFFCVILGALFVPSRFQDKSPSRLDEKKSTVGELIQFTAEDGGDRGRFKMWYHTLRMIADAPLFGVGLHNWSAYYPRYDQGDVMGIVVAPKRPHNDFLWIWAELGTVGLVLYLWILVCVAKQFWQGARLQNWGVVLAGLGALALLVHSGFSFPREQPIAVFYLSLALGVAGQRGVRGNVKSDGWNVGVGSAILAVGIVGCVWSVALYRFDIEFSRALEFKELSQHRNQIQAAQRARLAGTFDHRILLLEGLGRYALDDFKEATEVYHIYLKYQPYLPAVYNNLGRAYDGLGDDDKAELAYLKGLETFSGDGADVLLSNLAAVYKRQGKVDQALDIYQSSPHLPAEGYHNLGLIYAERGLWDQSLTAYHQALVQAPDMVIVHFSMAGVQLLQGDIEVASENFETFLKGWQGKPDYVRDAKLRLRQIYPVLGDQYLRAQRFGDAGRIYERLLVLGDQAPGVLNNLVLIYGRLRQFDKAVKFGQLALRDHPAFIQMHLSLGTVYQSRGDRERALMHYRKFISQSASDAPLVGRAQDRVARLIQQ